MSRTANVERPNTPPQQSSSASVRSRRSLRERTTFWFKRSHSTTRPGRDTSLSRPITSTENVPYLRPQTAKSTQSSKRKAEPLDTIRHSILPGSRKGDAPPPVSRDHERTDSNVSSTIARTNSVVSSVSRENFHKEDEYYRHLRKQSISTPFNFEHVTHTAKTQLPPLETVEEQDLPRQFWSVSARQRPKRHLNGIQADDLPRQHKSPESESSHPSSSKSRPVSPLTSSEVDDAPPHISTPVEPLASLDDSIFDAVTGMKSTTLSRTRSVRSRPHEPHFPRRYSSLNALRPGDENAEPKKHQLTTFYESESSDPSADEGRSKTQSSVPKAGLKPTNDSAAPVSSPQQRDGEPKHEDVAYRSKQPLPPVPKQIPSRGISKTSYKSPELGRVPLIALHNPNEHPGSPKSRRSSKRSSKRSSRSSRSLEKSLSQSSSTGVRQSTILSDTTWEDDVDYCYEQEAESTCYFNWDAAKASRALYVEDDDELNLMAAPYHAHSPTVTPGSGSHTKLNISKETIAERRSSKRFEELPRAPSSVGHRGFLAARRSSQDLSRYTPTPVQITPSSSTPNLLSPVLSVHENAEQKHPAPAALNDSGIASLNANFLNDTVSHRTSTSTRHTKSSSHGSNASSARASSKTSQTTSNRWSAASSTSVPDFMHSGPRNKLVLSKTIISAPLESLPQSPPYEKDGGESTIVPQGLQNQPVRNSFVVKRGQSPGDRASLIDGGKVATKRESSQPRDQRYRYSQAPQPAAVEAGSGPGWI